MPSAAFPAILFAAACSVGGLTFLSIQWARDTARLGPAPSAALRNMLLGFVGWLTFYVFVGWISVIALGIVTVALFMWIQLGGPGDRTSWDAPEQIRLSWWAATIVSAPSIWLAYLLKTGNW